MRSTLGTLTKQTIGRVRRRTSTKTRSIKLVVRSFFQKAYPRMVEILQLLGAGGLMMLPTQRDLESPIGPDIERYYQAAAATAPERIALFRLAWDVAGSAWGSRQVLYERFFSGDPVRLLAARFQSYDKAPYKARVRVFLEDTWTSR